LSKNIAIKLHLTTFTQIFDTEMKEQKKIPVGKIQRASRILNTSAKVGTNYVTHYTKKIFGSDDRYELDRRNADDIYDALSELKGGALKIAQMMSMNEALPQAFTEKFALAQFSAPPLSLPLVVKTFKAELGKAPSEIFDSFSQQAVNAASIGQVHLAEYQGRKLAVKVQYPGIADSLQSDIKMVKPLALRIMNISKAELDHYAGEVEKMLMEETDYEGELKRSVSMSERCKHLENIVFPTYYPELSSKRIITMDWIEGTLFADFVKLNLTQDMRNRVGQTLWDFYAYQTHTLKTLHADPHPGNFIVTPDLKLGVLDFGAVKEIPESVYHPYFNIVNIDFEKDTNERDRILTELNMKTDSDTPEVREILYSLFTDLVSIVRKPFINNTFDFGAYEMMAEMTKMGEKYKDNKTLRKMNAARGVRDAIYINRSYFGLYALLGSLKAEVVTNRGDGFMYHA